MHALSTFPAETKYFDTSFSAAVQLTADWAAVNIPMTSYLNETGALTGYVDSPLIPSSNGSGYGQVIGNKYLLKALRCRGEVSVATLSDQADVKDYPTVRLALVLDTQPNGAQETGANIFPDMGTAAQCCYSFQQMSAGMPGRFVILGNKTLTFKDFAGFNDGAAATPGTGSIVLAPLQFSFEKQWKRGLKVLIKSNAGGVPAIANYTDANIFLVAHAATGTGFVPTIRGCSRAYYVD